MPAFTSPDNIQYPVVGDNVTPLAGLFAPLAASVQAALTSLREDAVLPELPAPKSEKGADVQGITATAWADLPNMPTINFNVERPMWVQINLGAWVVATAGTTRISLRVTGATTLGETQVEVGGDNATWGQILFSDASAVTRQCSSTKIVRLNAGSNNITVRAYRQGTGTNQSNYTTLQVSPIRWAS